MTNVVSWRKEGIKYPENEAWLDVIENEEQWEDMEIVETQSKLEVAELIIDQLYNEVIEILEHVQLSRKMPDLYQDKSIYACEDIPKLSFQHTTNEN